MNFINSLRCVDIGATSRAEYFLKHTQTHTQMDLIELMSSNSAVNNDTNLHNQTDNQLWFWILGAVAILIILLIAVYFLRECMKRPRYRKTNRLDGKVVIVTGCNRGIGLETALEMARRGARVYMACRNFEKCELARQHIIKQTNNLQIFNRALDLASLDSVRQFVRQFLKEEQRLDILINNAAIITKRRQLSADGFELQLATNHLGHFLLTNLLLDVLKASAPSRVVIVSSSPHGLALLNTADLQSERSFLWFKAFFQSKYCNTLFGLKLAEILKDERVTVNCLYPGLVTTDLLFDTTWCLFHPILRCFAKSTESGAQTSIYLALDPELESVTGEFYVDMKRAHVASWVKNRQKADWLWQESLKLVGLVTPDK